MVAIEAWRASARAEPERFRRWALVRLEIAAKHRFVIDWRWPGRVGPTEVVGMLAMGQRDLLDKGIIYITPLITPRELSTFRASTGRHQP